MAISPMDIFAQYCIKCQFRQFEPENFFEIYRNLPEDISSEDLAELLTEYNERVAVARNFYDLYGFNALLKLVNSINDFMFVNRLPLPLGVEVRSHQVRAFFGSIEDLDAWTGPTSYGPKAELALTFGPFKVGFGESGIGSRSVHPLGIY